MLRWTRAAEGVDRLTGRIGVAVAWATLAMVLVGAFNALARWFDRFQVVEGNLSSNTYIELQWYLFSLVFLLGAADALRADRHVRVDVFYGRLGRRAQAWVDLAGSFLLLLPFCAFTLWASWPAVRNSFSIRETSPDPGGLARWPIKAVILVGFGLVALQGLSEAVKRIAWLRDGDQESLIDVTDAAPDEIAGAGASGGEGTA